MGIPDILLAGVGDGENDVTRLHVGMVQKGGSKVVLFGAYAIEEELGLWFGSNAAQLKWNDGSVGDLQWRSKLRRVIIHLTKITETKHSYM